MDALHPPTTHPSGSLTLTVPEVSPFPQTLGCLYSWPPAGREQTGGCGRHAGWEAKPELSPRLVSLILSSPSRFPSQPAKPANQDQSVLIPAPSTNPCTMYVTSPHAPPVSSAHARRRVSGCCELDPRQQMLPKLLCFCSPFPAPQGAKTDVDHCPMYHSHRLYSAAPSAIISM